MRLIKPSTLRQWAERYPEAAEALAVWQRLIESNPLPHFAALRRVFPHADQVAVKNRRTVTVFNVRGNRYRLIAALHYNRKKLYIRAVLTHTEYDTETWKP